MTLPRKYNHGSITRPENVAEIFRAVLNAEHECDQDKEHFWVIGLTTRKTIKYIDLTSLGLLGACLVHPREVFRLAIAQGVDAVIIVHNHPSGDTEPSEEDLKTTRRMVEAGKILGIEVVDHLIVTTNGDYASLKTRQLF